MNIWSEIEAYTEEPIIIEEELKNLDDRYYRMMMEQHELFNLFNGRLESFLIRR